MFETFFKNYISSKNIVFILLSILFIIFVFKNSDIAIMFFASYVLACSLNPFVNKLVEKKKLSRSIASAIVLGCGLLVVFLFLIPTVILAGSEVKTFATSFPRYIGNIEDFLRGLPFFDLSLKDVDVTSVLSSLSESSQTILNNIMDTGKEIGAAFIYVVISIMVIYYFMADKDSIKSAYLKSFPMQMRKKAESIINIISQKVGGYIFAQLVTIASVGLVMAIGLSVMRIDYALLLALITMVLDLIPVVGPTIALVICVIATSQSGIVAVTTVIVVFAIAQLVENNFVRPFVFGKFLNLHPLLIYLFLFIMAKYAGIVGVVFAPAVAATVCVLYEELYMKNLN